jgi:hypothetical protein
VRLIPAQPNNREQPHTSHVEVCAQRAGRAQANTLLLLRGGVPPPNPWETVVIL